MYRLLLLFLSASLLWGCAKKTETIEKAVSDQTQLSNEPQKEQKKNSKPRADTATHNPFLTREEEKLFTDIGKTQAIPLDSLIVSAILYSTVTKSRAIINGSILQKGDTIDNKEVVDIQQETVILKDGRTEYIAKLKE